jgi:hypothetical protein
MFFCVTNWLTDQPKTDKHRFTQEKMTMQTYKLSVYKLRTKEALDFYSDVIYPRHRCRVSV